MPRASTRCTPTNHSARAGRVPIGRCRIVGMAWRISITVSSCRARPCLTHPTQWRTFLREWRMTRRFMCQRTNMWRIVLDGVRLLDREWHSDVTHWHMTAQGMRHSRTIRRIASSRWRITSSRWRTSGVAMRHVRHVVRYIEARWRITRRHLRQITFVMRHITELVRQ